MLVEFGPGAFVRQTVEVGEKIRLISRLCGSLFRHPPQVVDQHLGVHLLLDVERGRLHHQVGPFQQVLAPPDQLRIQIAVPPFIGNLNRALVPFRNHRLIFDGRDVFARRLLMGQRFYPLLALRFAPGRHGQVLMV